MWAFINCDNTQRTLASNQQIDDMWLKYKLKYKYITKLHMVENYYIFCTLFISVDVICYSMFTRL